MRDPSCGNRYEETNTAEGVILSEALGLTATLRTVIRNIASAPMKILRAAVALACLVLVNVRRLRRAEKLR